MKEKKNQPKIRGIYLLVFVAIIYVYLFASGNPIAPLAISTTGKIMLKIIPIIGLVIIFTSIINYFIKPKQLARHLNKDSGIKGWLWALLIGVISHGSMYLWYPMIDELRKKGMRNGLIATFFFARAIKIPFLPMMIHYFGYRFTILLSFYILLSALIQGWLMEIVIGSESREQNTP